MMPKTCVTSCRKTSAASANRRARRTAALGLALVPILAATLRAVPSDEFAQLPITTEAAGVNHALLVDVDGDGDLDVVFESPDGVAWSENIDGTGDFGAPIEVATTHCSFCYGPVMGDLDGDGDADLIAMRYDAIATSYQVSWYENLGSGVAFGPPTDLVETFEFSTRFELLDMDGDGDLDVICSPFAYYSAVQFVTIENQGGGTFAAPVQLPPLPADDFVTVHQIRPADVDGDGDVDLVLSYEQAPASISLFSEATRWLENRNGMGGFLAADVISFEAPFGAIQDVIAVGDIDGDGDADVVAGHTFGTAPARWYPQTTTGEFGAPVPLVSGGPFRAIEVADMDGDGDVDVITTKDVDSGLAPPVWHENLTGNGDFAAAVPLSSSGVFTDTIALGDADGDGDVDVVGAAQTAGAVYWYRNPTASPFWSALGVGTAGSQGLPTLNAQGALTEDALVTVTVCDAPALASAFMVLGTSALQAPFKGGVMVPQPELILGGQTDASGQLSIGGLWVETPAGIPVIVQSWIVDGGGPAGYSATVGLMGTTE